MFFNTGKFFGWGKFFSHFVKGLVLIRDVLIKSSTIPSRGIVLVCPSTKPKMGLIHIYQFFATFYLLKEAKGELGEEGSVVRGGKLS